MDHLNKNLITRATVGDILKRSAIKHAQKTAVVEPGENLRLTYGELNNSANKFANALLGLNLKKGERVSTICANSTRFLISYMGTAKTNYIFNPINPGISLQDLAYILQHVETSVLIVDSVFLGAVKDVIDKVETIKHKIVINIAGAQENNNAFQEFDQFLEQGSDQEVESVEIWERDIVQIQYTSGTTAAPRGAMHSHLSLYISSLSNIIEGRIKATDVMSCTLPLFHCAQQCFVNSALHLGAAVVITRQFDPGKMLELIEKEKLSWLFLLPMMYRAMVEHPDVLNYDYSALRFCLYAMTPMDEKTLERAITTFNAEFSLGSGQTEAYPATCFFKPEDQLSKKGSYWGEPVLTVDMAIMDDEGSLLDQGQVGELVYRGPHVMEGYFKDEESTANTFRFAWHHSGDIGKLDEDGRFIFIDRKKDMIKTGGENVPSIKVERVLLQMPKIQNAAVIGLPHEYWGEAVTAIVVPREGQNLNEEEVIQWCKTHLSGFEVPKKAVIVQELPATSTGKLQKYKLRESYLDYFQKS